MSRDPRVGYARGLRRADMSGRGRGGVGKRANGKARLRQAISKYLGTHQKKKHIYPPTYEKAERPEKGQ